MSSAPTSSSDLGQRLYTRLNQLFESDPNIDELGLVISADPTLYGLDNDTITLPPTPDRATLKAQLQSLSFNDTSLHDADEGAPFLLHSHKLAIAFWCIPHIVKYNMKLFQKLRATAAAVQWQLQQLSADVLQQMLYSTRILLCINADHYTAWNVRKRIIQYCVNCESTTATPTVSIQSLWSVQQEISFLNLIYSKHPKSGKDCFTACCSVQSVFLGTRIAIVS